MTTTRTPAANRFQPIDPQPDGAPPMPNQTDKTLVQIRTELLTTFSATDWESYNHLVSWLRDTDWPCFGELRPRSLSKRRRRAPGCKCHSPLVFMRYLEQEVFG